MDINSYTPEEVAAALNITKNTVYEMVKRGELPAYRIGRKIRIDAKSIAEYKEKKQNDALYTEKYEQSFFVIGGQDVILDILARYLETENPGAKVLRSHKGSYNCLYDLYNDRVNAATAHLWDGDSNTYNSVYIKSMLPGVPATIIHLAKRFQGFYVKSGNPKTITGWEDLRRTDIKFVNRERGSGTRVLLDERMRLMEINPEQLDGYNTVANSHILVASTVARGIADFGMGNEKAIQQVNGLEFIPLQKENYDLILKSCDLDLPMVQSLVGIATSDQYKKEIRSLGGYEL